MSIKTLDERVRAQGREEYKREVQAAVASVRALVSNVSAVKGVAYEGKDITEERLLEVLEQHLVNTQSFRAEEDAVSEFMERYKEWHHQQDIVAPEFPIPPVKR